MENLINELKQMQQHLKLYLANFFGDLKRDVDLVYALKLEHKTKYLEIINQIEIYEQDCYKIKAFNTFDQEIKLLEQAEINSNIKKK